MRDKTHITLDAFEQFIRLPENADRLFELIDGEIVEKVPNEIHAVIEVSLTVFLYQYAKTQGGRVLTNARFRPTEASDSDLLPDVAFRAPEGLKPPVAGVIIGFPDLAVEIKSPDDSYTKMRLKANYYLEHGTRLVWLVLPERRTVEVYYANGDHTILTEADGGVLDGADVLPGFTLALADVFSQI